MKGIRISKHIVWFLLAAAMLRWTFLPMHAHAQKNYIDIGEIGSSAKVVLHPGDVLRVVLKSNVSTGYGWQVAANVDAILQIGPLTNLPGDTHMPGAEGRQRWEFTAKAIGNDTLMLAYARPWEKNVAPARELTLDITVTTQAIDPALAVEPAGLLFGKFTGKTPCADCSGIDQTVLLYSPGPNNFVDAYYVQSMTYLGGRSGNTTKVSAGTWFIEKGSAANPNATVYALSVDSSNRTQNFQIEGGSLIPLDADLKLIQSPFDASLHRVSKGR